MRKLRKGEGGGGRIHSSVLKGEGRLGAELGICFNVFQEMLPKLPAKGRGEGEELSLLQFVHHEIWTQTTKPEIWNNNYSETKKWKSKDTA